MLTLLVWRIGADLTVEVAVRRSGDGGAWEGLPDTETPEPIGMTPACVKARQTGLRRTPQCRWGLGTVLYWRQPAP